MPRCVCVLFTEICAIVVDLEVGSHAQCSPVAAGHTAGEETVAMIFRSLFAIVESAGVKLKVPDGVVSKAGSLSNCLLYSCSPIAIFTFSLLPGCKVRLIYAGAGSF